MTINSMQTSFAGGEFSPSLYARVDLEKFSVGAAKMLNWLVDYRGGAFNRPGTQFCAEVNPVVTTRARLIPFIVAESRAYVLEFGDQYIRFYADGAQLADIGLAISAITQANPGVVTSAGHGYTTGQEVFLESIGGMTELSNRNFNIVVLSVNTFSLIDSFGVPVNTSGFAAYTGGGFSQRIYEIASPYAAVDLPLLKFTQSADVLTITHPLYAPRDLTRTTASTFTLALQSIGPSIDPPTGLTGAPHTGGPLLFGYVVTAVSLDGREESYASFPFVIKGHELDGLIEDNALQWSAPGQPVSGYRVYKWGPLQQNRALPTAFGYIGETKATHYVDNNFAPDYSKTPPEYRNPFVPGQIESITVVTGGTSTVNAYTALTIVDGTGTGAEAYASVDGVSGELVGVVIVKGGQNYTAPVITGGTATFSYTLTSADAPYPAAVSYFQQRRVYGAPAGYPERLIMSQIGAYNNFDVSPVVLDTDAITISLASREVNAIRSMVPTSTGLVVFTSGGASLVGGGGTNTAITPSNVINSPQASTGANNLPPLLINYDILFMQAKGSVVRDLAFNYGVQSYYGFDRSALASHLFSGKTFSEWAWAEEPHKLVHAIRNDGTLITLAYVPEQEVYGWSPHQTQGLFESVCSIPEGNENAVYYIIRRKVGGVWKRYVERLSTRQFAEIEDAWFVDAGLALPQFYPQFEMTAEFSIGDDVDFSTDGGAFDPSMVGKVIWAAGGKAEIHTYVNPTSVKCAIVKPLTAVIPQTDGAIPLPQAAGEWSIGTPVTRIGGLWHLVGKTVTGLGDGLVIPPTVVDAGGGIDVAAPVSKAIVGLGYYCDLQTLTLILDPKQQSSRSNIVAMTLRVDKTRGLFAGTSFDKMVELKDLMIPYTPPPTLFTGDTRVIPPGKWSTEATLCIRQPYPLPAAVLGVMPEIVSGDTGR